MYMPLFEGVDCNYMVSLTNLYAQYCSFKRQI